MRDITVSIEVFRMIWSKSTGGEECEDDILRRLLAAAPADMTLHAPQNAVQSWSPGETRFWDGIRSRLHRRCGGRRHPAPQVSPH